MGHMREPLGIGWALMNFSLISRKHKVQRGRCCLQVRIKEEVLDSEHWGVSKCMVAGVWPRIRRLCTLFRSVFSACCAAFLPLPECRFGV